MSEDATDLRSYAWDEWSQYGEDGILARIFELLGTDDDAAWCVEFGAWDGKYLSNTHCLISRRSWNAVLIEANQAKFRELQSNMRGFAGVSCINTFVGLDSPNDLDSILAGTALPVDFELLAIDIDGADYHIWSGFSTFSPKVVIIEINVSIPNHVEFVQARDSSVNQGASLLSMTRLASGKGYDLVAVTEGSALFVRRDLFPLLGVTDNSLDALSPNAKYQTDLFQLFDGTIVLHGNQRMLWHGIDMSPASMQVIPRPLRVFPGQRSHANAVLWAVWCRLLLGTPLPLGRWWTLYSPLSRRRQRREAPTDRAPIAGRVELETEP